MVVFVLFIYLLFISSKRVKGCKEKHFPGDRGTWLSVYVEARMQWAEGEMGLSLLLFSECLCTFSISEAKH